MLRILSTCLVMSAITCAPTMSYAQEKDKETTKEKDVAKDKDAKAKTTSATRNLDSDGLYEAVQVVNPWAFVGLHGLTLILLVLILWQIIILRGRVDKMSGGGGA